MTEHISVSDRPLGREISDFTADEGGTETEIPTDSDRTEYIVRQRLPVTFVLDADVDERYAAPDGTITCFRAPRAAEIGQRVRDAIDNSNPDVYQALYRQLAVESDVGRTEITRTADLEYGGKPVAVGLGHGANTTIAFDAVDFEDVHPAPSKFTVREYVAEGAEHETVPEYEYVVVVVAPEQSAAEADANTVASDLAAGPALNLNQEETSMVTLVAVGAVLGAAAVYGSGRMDVGRHHLDETTVDPGASVDDLVAAREELLT